MTQTLNLQGESTSTTASSEHALCRPDYITLLPKGFLADGFLAERILAERALWQKALKANLPCVRELCFLQFN